MTPSLRTLALPAALVATLALASCGAGSSTPNAGGSPSATGAPPATGLPHATGLPSATGTPSPVGPPAGPTNAADIEFANTMTFYLRYEEAMADLVPTRAKDAKVKALASTIKKAQGPEITRMSGWLVGGGIPAPTFKDGEVVGHTMSGMGGQTKAMLSKPEMTALVKATGSAFDRMWLQLMIRHHEGAAVTAKAQLAKGINAEARQVAQTIIGRQSPQIAEMKEILTGLPQS